MVAFWIEWSSLGNPSFKKKKSKKGCNRKVMVFKNIYKYKVVIEGLAWKVVINRFL